MRGLPFVFPGSSAFPPPSYLNVHLGGLKKCGRKSRRQNRGEKTLGEKTRHRRERRMERRHLERRQNIGEKTPAHGENLEKTRWGTKHRREGTIEDRMKYKIGEKTHDR